MWLHIIKCSNMSVIYCTHVLHAYELEQPPCNGS